MGARGSIYKFLTTSIFINFWHKNTLSGKDVFWLSIIYLTVSPNIPDIVTSNVKVCDILTPLSACVFLTTKMFSAENEWNRFRLGLNPSSLM